MAIQFPPVSQGDPEPIDGDTYLYLVTGEEFVCRRNSPTQAAQWAANGTFNGTNFEYVGTLEIQQPAPVSELGQIYSVIDGGTADASFGSLGGLTIEQWSLVIYAGSDWNLVTAAATSPWVRTLGGEIQPVVQTDSLDMVDGNYVIESLPNLP